MSISVRFLVFIWPPGISFTDNVRRIIDFAHPRWCIVAANQWCTVAANYWRIMPANLWCIVAREVTMHLEELGIKAL